MAKYAYAAIKPSDTRGHVDQIVTTLEQNMPSGKRVTEIVKGGSLGHGTAVPGGDFDLDLVAYFSNIDPRDFDKSKAKEYLEVMDRILRNKFGDNYHLKCYTKHALEFTLVCHSIKLKVDLLPSPFFDDPDEFHSFLKKKNDVERRRFSCTAAKWIQDFFQKQPNEVKEYIRRAKAWRNKNWPEDCSDGKPKSFLISLLVIEAFDKSSPYEGRRPHEVNENVKRYVLNHSDLRIHWTHRGAMYDPFKYVGYFQPPYIIDPSNPFNNVYESGISDSVAGNYDPGNGDWSVLVRKIHSFDVSQVNY